MIKPCVCAIILSQSLNNMTFISSKDYITFSKVEPKNKPTMQYNYTTTDEIISEAVEKSIYIMLQKGSIE